jgi:hypothetical protein
MSKASVILPAATGVVALAGLAWMAARLRRELDAIDTRRAALAANGRLAPAQRRNNGDLQ